jgi:molybdopterin molybdotransferase
MKTQINDRQIGRALLPYEDAISRLFAAVNWKLPAETVPVTAAYSRVLAEEVKAGLDVPRFAKATMDGYAVRAADVKGAGADWPAELKVVEDLPAGTSPRRRVGPGQAARIMTGAPIPAGADAVVQVERTERDDAARAVKIFASVAPGDNVGPAGEDVKKGAVVLPRGTRIGPAQMGMLAALGKARVKVSRRPRVAVLSTGDEVQQPGKPLRSGQIYDANGYSLLGLVSERGCDAVLLGIAPDRPAALRKKLTAARADLVLMTGGVSVGDYDFAAGLLAELGVKEIFYKVAIQPGMPTFAGIKGRCLFYGLPGNPVSAMVCFHLFVRPALNLLTGDLAVGMRQGRAILAADIKVKPGRRKFLRARALTSGPDLRVLPYPNQKSGVLSSMLATDLLIEVPGETDKIAAGSEVNIYWL